MTRPPRRAKTEAFSRIFEDDFGENFDNLINEENVVHVEVEEEQLDDGLTFDDDGDPLPVEMLDVVPENDHNYSDSDEGDEILPLRQRIESNKIENIDHDVEDSAGRARGLHQPLHLPRSPSQERNAAYQLHGDP